MCIRDRYTYGTGFIVRSRRRRFDREFNWILRLKLVAMRVVFRTRFFYLLPK